MQVLLKNLIMTSPETSNQQTKSAGIYSLRNKFSGYKLFRDYYYNLVTGDFEILERTVNRYFFENIIDFSRIEQDISLLPALRKIAYNPVLSESIRQKASETIEMIEEGTPPPRQPETKDEDKNIRAKIANARKMLSGHRYPQTTEILRLLREKSPELKRIALCLVGKFKMTDMSQEVCECLNNPDIAADATKVLQTIGSEIRNELRRFCLASSGNLSTGKNIIRILGKTCTGDNTEFLLSLLWSNSRQIRETALEALINCGFKVSEHDRKRLVSMLYETFGLMAWILSAEVCLEKNIDYLLLDEMNYEYSRWKKFAAGLMKLIPDAGESEDHTRTVKKKADDLSGYINQISETILTDKSKSHFSVHAGSGYYLRMLKKLKRFFPVEVPSYKELLEDLINRDYNTVSIWTKVCALRNIAALEDENLAESVAALLFSPEQILREEAARLIARTGSDLYAKVKERLDADQKKRLDIIIDGHFNEKELLYNKVIFLKSCLPSIPEEKLYNLASALQYITNREKEVRNSLLWVMSIENPIPHVDIVYNTPEKSSYDVLRSDGGFGYVLPVSALSDFEYQYPEEMSDILKYIDDNEEE